jgi:TolB protein
VGRAAVKVRSLFGVATVALLLSACAAARPTATATIPTQSWILYQRLTGAGGGIFLMHPDGSDEHALAPEVSGEQIHPDWSPDGKNVVFVVDGVIFIKAIAGSSAAEAIILCCDYPAWSPDGSRIAYTAYENGDSAGPAASLIEVYDIATTKVTVSARLERPTIADVPRWSPDGKNLVVGVDQMDGDGTETGSAIAVIPVDGSGAPRYLTKFDSFAYAPDWNRTGDLILFSDETRGAQKPPGDIWNLFVMRPDGSGLRQVTTATAATRLRNASWTADGAGIIAVLDASAEIVLVDPATGTLTSIGGENTAHPRVQPTS